MGQINLKLAPTQLEDLVRRTDFTREQLKEFYEKFIKEYPSGYMTKPQFAKVYQDYYKNGQSITFAEHVFRVFDVNGDGKIDFREFICSLSLTTNGTIEEKLRWAFNMYDVNGDGNISINEISSIVKSVQALINARDANLSEEKLYQMFATCDRDSDGSLTVDEFIRGTKKNPVFMKLLTDYVQ